MTNQIERLQAQFYGLNIDQKRGFIESLQDELYHSNNPEWRAYLQPFISRCIMEYNEEIQRPVAVATYDTGRYDAPAPQAPQPGNYPPPDRPVYESHYNPHSGSKVDEILDNITNAVPVSGGTILFYTSILLVIFAGVAMLVSTLLPLEAIVSMDIFTPLRGMTWLTSFMLESALNVLRLVTGILGIVCVVRPEIARKCRMLGIILLAYRLVFAVISWNALRDLPSEITDAMGGYLALNIVGWILPVVFILAAHKMIGMSEQGD